MEGKIKKWIELIQTEKLADVTNDVQVSRISLIKLSLSYLHSLRYSNGGASVD